MWSCSVDFVCHYGCKTILAAAALPHSVMEWSREKLSPSWYIRWHFYIHPSNYLYSVIFNNTNYRIYVLLLLLLILIHSSMESHGICCWIANSFHWMDPCFLNYFSQSLFIYYTCYFCDIFMANWFRGYSFSLVTRHWVVLFDLRRL